MTNEVQLDGIGLTQMIRPVPPFDTSTAPTDGQALVWDAAASKYKPGGGASTLAATTTSSYQILITTPTTSSRVGLRIEQKGTDGVYDAAKIVNDSASYALKIDQSGAGGVHDTVNVVANFTGAHTALGVNAQNTTLSTVKVVNSAAQTGGAVIAALGTDATRSAAIFNAENSGTGPGFLATQHVGSTGAALQVAYDVGSTYSSRALWISGLHTSGQLVQIDNASAQTSGVLMQLAQSNASTSVPVLSLSQAGTGDYMTAGNFSINSQGFIRVPQIFNIASFNNSRIQLTNTGMIVDRTVVDANPTLSVQNLSASNTGNTIEVKGAGNVLGSRFDKNAYFMTRKTAAPADADLTSSEAALWLDATNGAAKLMIKAKQADGTVRTGSVTLS
jgi:hypothetical protein